MLVDPVLEPGGGPGDAEGGEHAVRVRSTGAAIAGEPDLELVDGGGEAAAGGPSAQLGARARRGSVDGRGRCGARGGPAGSGQRAVGVEHLAQRGAVRGHVDLVPVARRRAGRSTRPGRCARRRRRGRRRGARSRRSRSPTVSSTGRASRAICGHGSCTRGVQREQRPGDVRRRPASRSTSSVRSRAASRREVVDRARPVSSLELGEAQRLVGAHDQVDQRGGAVDGLRARRCGAAHRDLV